jgi:hypothetical protein
MAMTLGQLLGTAHSAPGLVRWCGGAATALDSL